jgi:hypothetical protein
MTAFQQDAVFLASQDNPDLFFGRVSTSGLALDVLDHIVGFIGQARFFLSHHRLLQES